MLMLIMMMMTVVMVGATRGGVTKWDDIEKHFG